MRSEGTVGAAMMGAYYGLPALAVSLGGGNAFDYSARFVASLVEEFRQRPPHAGVVFSVNIPRATEEEIEGVVVAKMGGSHLGFAYQEVAGTSGARVFRPPIGLLREAPAGTDTDAYLNNMITIAPLLFDWTATSVVDELQSWSLTHEVGR